MSELENQLRAELRRHAEQAPSGTLLAERIVAGARTEPRPSGRRGWPTWTMPLLAAGAVAAIVTGVFVGVSQIRNDAAPTVPGLGTAAPTLSHSAPAPSPAPTVESTPPPSPTTSGTPAVPDNPVGLANFAISDVTFVGTDDGWALGTADCLKGPGTCPAMVRTSDGGKSWHSMTQPPGDVTGIRFATDQIGYAYGPSVLEMTTDGGRSWAPQDGGAIALETLDSNVIRLVAGPTSGCPGPCNVRVEYAGVGSDQWTGARLSSAPVDAGGTVSLVRAKDAAYVLVGGNPAKGRLPGALYVSQDGGARWTSRGEPCARAGRPYLDVSTAVAAAPGVVAAICTPYQAGAGAFVAISRDAGASFTARDLPEPYVDRLAGDPSTVLVAAGTHAYRSTDGGASWAPISAVTGTATFVGFESQTLGRIVTDGGRTIWTTTDAGVHWTAFSFPS